MITAERLEKFFAEKKDIESQLLKFGKRYHELQHPTTYPVSWLEDYELTDPKHITLWLEGRGHCSSCPGESVSYMVPLELLNDTKWEENILAALVLEKAEKNKAAVLKARTAEEKQIEQDKKLLAKLQKKYGDQA